MKALIVRRIAASHLAGPSLDDAVRVARMAAARGWSCTIGPWNDPADTAPKAARDFCSVLDAIGREKLDGYLSMKLPTIKYDESLLRDVLAHARTTGLRVHFDGMDPESADPTLAIVERSLGSGAKIGCTIPARWRRSAADARRVAKFGIPVRIVKGQWSDPASPGEEVKRNFVAIARALAEEGAPLVGVATHDRPLAAKALKIFAGTQTKSEMEQLSSLPQNCSSLARSMNVPMRIYIPYGYPSLPYNITHVKARPAIVGWVIRDFILGGRKKL